MIEIVSFGDLVENGSYHVHSRFAHVVNMTDNGRLVSLVTPDVDAGPLNIVVRGLDPSRVGSLTMETGMAITIDGRRITLEGDRAYESALDFQPHALPLFRKNLGILGVLLAELAPEKSLAFLLDSQRLAGFRDGFERAVVEHIGHSVRDILHGDTLRGVERLKGCGFGLTPSGDDFITGLLIATHIIERSTEPAHRASAPGRDLTHLRTQIFETARSGNTLSDTFLYLAEGGFVTQGIKDLVAALSFGAPGDVRRCAEHLFSVGATSGADMAVGLQMTLTSWLARPAAATAWNPSSISIQHDGEAQWS